MTKPEIPVSDVLNYFNISKTDPANWLEIVPDKEWKFKKTTMAFEILTIYSVNGKKRIYTLDDKSILDIKLTGPSSVIITGQVYQVNDS